MMDQIEWLKLLYQITEKQKAISAEPRNYYPILVPVEQRLNSLGYARKVKLGKTEWVAA